MAVYHCEFGWGDEQVLIATVQATDKEHAWQLARKLRDRIAIQLVEREPEGTPAPPPMPPTTAGDDDSRWRRPPSRFGG
jgi:hypothetical protein